MLNDSVAPEKTDTGLSPEQMFDILSHKIRREIIVSLSQKVELTYTQLLEMMKISDGLLSFHLRKLKELVNQSDSGSYLLSQEGRAAFEIIRTVQHSLRSVNVTEEVPKLTSEIVTRRIAALLVDALVFFTFTGVFLDTVLWGLVFELFGHFSQVFTLHPWIFHLEHIPMSGELATRVVGIYAHIFFAIFIVLSLLEAFKGQTPGKFLLGIRVIKDNGEKIGLLEAGIRNSGKIFLLPLDLIIGLLFYRKRGYLRFFDYYTEVHVELVKRI